jgi:pimeloyl-ACP methyl ester carboxylesterase
VTASAVAEREGTIHTPDGRGLAYAEWGPADGPVVLMFHGMPGSRLLCPDVKATHRRGTRLVAVDRPGYGGSSPRPGRRIADWAEDASLLLDGLAIPAASIVGWSSGGPYALACAAILGERIRSVAVIAGDAPLDDVPEAFQALPAAMQDLIARVRDDPTGDARAAVAARCAWYAQDPLSIVASADAHAAPDDPDAEARRRPDIGEALAAMFTEGARQGAAGYVDDWIATVLPWGFRLTDVARPVAIWWGDRDPLTPRSDTEHLASSVPGAQVRIIPGEGHSLPFRHWPAILDALD